MKLNVRPDVGSKFLFTTIVSGAKLLDEKHVSMGWNKGYNERRGVVSGVGPNIKSNTGEKILVMGAMIALTVSETNNIKEYSHQNKLL